MKRIWNGIAKAILIIGIIIGFLLGIACAVILITGVDSLVNMLPTW